MRFALTFVEDKAIKTDQEMVGVKPLPVVQYETAYVRPPHRAPYHLMHLPRPETRNISHFLRRFAANFPLA